MALSQQAQSLQREFIDAYQAQMTEEEKTQYQESLAECGVDTKMKARMNDFYLYQATYDRMVYDAETAMYGKYNGSYYETEGLDVKIDSCFQREAKADERINKVNNKNDGWFNNNEFVDVGFLEDQKNDKGEVTDKGLYTKLAEAQAGGFVEDANMYQESISILEAERDSQMIAKTVSTKEREKYESQFAVQSAKCELSHAYTSGNEADIQAASDKYMQAYVSDFDKYSSDYATGIDSQAEAQIYEDKAAKVAAFKEALGITTAATATATVVGPELPPEIEDIKTETISAPKYNSAASVTPDATISVSDTHEMTDAEKREAIAAFAEKSKNPSINSASEAAAFEAQRAEIDGYKADLIASFEEESKNPHINSAGDAQRFQARYAEIAGYKTDLGLNEKTETATASVAAVSSSNTATVESVTNTTPAASVTNTEAGKTDTSVTADGKKPDPYAFTNPERPANMSDADYTALCETEKAAHIEAVNKECADRIWIKGDYGCGQERIDGLAADGYDVSAVQGILNEKVAALNAIDKPVATPVKTAEPVAETKPEVATKSGTIEAPKPMASNNAITLDAVDKTPTPAPSTKVAPRTLANETQPAENISRNTKTPVVEKPAESTVTNTISRTNAKTPTADRPDITNTATTKPVNNLSFDAPTNDVSLKNQPTTNMQVKPETLSSTPYSQQSNKLAKLSEGARLADGVTQSNSKSGEYGADCD